ncbi:MAG TPA: divalent-cation tolerance protein CutA [Caldisericia bacterium]|nr:divalent-cation tolerance protein CutA [Caldisericia bacterium]
MENRFIIVLSTIDDIDKGKRISKLIIEKKLGACVNLVGPIQSTYFWRGKIEESKEWLILIKTKKDLYKKLEELIIKIHPYVTPEIIYFEIGGGFDKYLNWIVDVTEGKEENNDKYV